MKEATKKRVSLWIVTAVAGVLAYAGASIAWAEFGPAGQKQDSVNACIEQGTDQVMADRELDGDTIGVALDNMIAGCNELYK